MVDVQDIARKLDTEGTPALKRLPAIAQQLQDSLTSANRPSAAAALILGSSAVMTETPMIPCAIIVSRNTLLKASVLAWSFPETLLSSRTTTKTAIWLAPT